MVCGPYYILCKTLCLPACELFFKGMILTKECVKSTALKNVSSHYVFLQDKFLHWYLFLVSLSQKIHLFIQSVVSVLIFY